MAKWLKIWMRVSDLARGLGTALLLLLPLSSALAESERISVGWSPGPGLIQNGALDRLRNHRGVYASESGSASLVVCLSHEVPCVGPLADDRLSRFSVGVMRHLFERAGLQVHFVAMAARNRRPGPAKGRLDPVPMTATGREKPVKSSFGLPMLAAPNPAFSLHTKAESLPVSDRSKVGLAVLSTDLSLVGNGLSGRVQAVSYASVAGLILGPLTGGSDAALHERHRMIDEQAERRFNRRLTEGRSEILDVDPVAGFRLGLSPQIFRLNAVIPGSLASLGDTKLGLAWLYSPSNWIATLLPSILGAVGAGLVFAMGGGIWYRYQRRLHEARRDIAEDLIDKIPMGIVLVGRDGRIKYVNKATATTAAAVSGHLAVGNLYETALRGLLAEDRADLGGVSMDDWIDCQMQEIWADGLTREIQLNNGATFLRTTKLLKGGESLLLRHDVTEELCPKVGDGVIRRLG
ncbi:hypothetical protein [Antarctobacter heliothermus]|uniref:PAS domain-containing protein n=1 Tax=Antarctobacter heliothermus TaxID=74033 RepID=A0A239MAK6_9RHOB|nr:hypothetical protein [Antarctobacter heliothermus]SNT39113.1 hypothetical protein SAMN04488078_11312 [Antarctobacter heliothermus]